MAAEDEGHEGSTAKKGKWGDWVKKHKVEAIGAIAGVLGVILVIYFHSKSSASTTAAGAAAAPTNAQGTPEGSYSGYGLGGGGGGSGTGTGTGTGTTTPPVTTTPTTYNNNPGNQNTFLTQGPSNPSDYGLVGNSGGVIGAATDNQGFPLAPSPVAQQAAFTAQNDNASLQDGSRATLDPSIFGPGAQAGADGPTWAEQVAMYPQLGGGGSSGQPAANVGQQQMAGSKQAA